MFPTILKGDVTKYVAKEEALREALMPGKSEPVLA